MTEFNKTHSTQTQIQFNNSIISVASQKPLQRQGSDLQLKEDDAVEGVAHGPAEEEAAQEMEVGP